MIVQKYGGSSVATVEKIKRVAEKIKRVIQEGEKVCVVVSAMGKTTDGLISLAKKISGTPEPRELDMLLSTGEQVTAALLSIALNELGIPSVSLNALQLEMITTPDFNNARIIDINTEKLMEEFKTNDVVVVTGFQGITDFKDVTTLGRGGSDTSAVAIAAKLNARCEIYSDVPGIFACDPKIVPSAKKLSYITYDELMELASMGAKVIHFRAVEIAKKFNVELYSTSAHSNERGTYVVNTLPDWLEQPVVTGVAMDKNQRKFVISPLPGGQKTQVHLFMTLASQNINLDMISMIKNNGNACLSFTVTEDASESVRKTVKHILSEYGEHALVEDDEVAKITAVGVGIDSTPGVAARFFAALDKEGIKLLGTSTSEIKISTLVPRSNAEKAAKAVAEEFDLA
ncbi:MAG TPA: aspartate kinase [Acetomicrobium sp.]|uniref:aspartate kinase n=1 Tax=Acetomicrobium mobile TaxID=97477 RepID=UPI0026F048EE|nr:aspartate kinase [Acetomicrobium mobile]HQA36474.1 aspartate kinase [Acetomicrobium sp.]